MRWIGSVVVLAACATTLAGESCLFRGGSEGAAPRKRGREVMERLKNIDRAAAAGAHDRGGAYRLSSAGSRPRDALLSGGRGGGPEESLCSTRCRARRGPRAPGTLICREADGGGWSSSERRDELPGGGEPAGARRGSALPVRDVRRRRAAQFGDVSLPDGWRLLEARGSRMRTACTVWRREAR